MRIIRPTAVTDTVLASSSVPETDYPEWVAGTTYALGARVIIAASHQVFESLAAGNLGHNPITDASNPPKWLALGATNRWRMFDTMIGSVTAQAEAVSVQLAPGLINALALFGLQAGSVTITMMNGAELVYSRTVELVSPLGESSFYAYCFEPISRRVDIVVWDLPAYPGATLQMQVSQPDGVAEVGLLVVGLAKRLGSARWGCKFGIVDYSRKERDEFGNWTVVERSFSKSATATAEIKTSEVSALHKLLASLRAVPVVWEVAEGVEAGLIYGYYKSFSIPLSYPTVSYCDLDIEGLT